MHNPTPTDAVRGHAPHASFRWLRRLAAPAAGLLIGSIAVSLTPAPAAQALTSGTLAVSPSAGSLVALETTRLSSKTGVDIVVPASLPFYGAVQLRSATTSVGYRAKLGIAATGVVTVSLSRVTGGAETALGTPQSAGLTVKAGDAVHLEGVVVGLNPVLTYVRAWKVGATAPSWQLAARDYTAARISTEGQTRLWAYLAPSAPAPATVGFSNVVTVAVDDATAASYPVTTWVTAGTPPAPAPAPTPTPTPTPTPAAPGKPSAATTGVKAGTVLTRHDGDITVKVDGTVLDKLDIHGFVIVRAKNVTISNSIVRGGPAQGFATGLITDYGYQGLLITDTTVQPEFPSVWLDGIKGSGYTARRVHVIGGVDSMKVQGDNTTVEDSLLENTNYYASDPEQGGTPTHNDNIQVQNGANVKITGNTIRGATNFAILGAASTGNLNLVVKNNWLDGGHCTLKLQIVNGWAETASVTGNKFGPNRAVSTCPFTAYPAVTLTQNTNTMELTGAPVTPLVVVS